MDQTENANRLQLLKKYLKDPSKKRLSKSRQGGVTYYQFQDWVRDLPDERRQGHVHFNVYQDGEVYMYRRTERSQKFLCVGGPLAGQKSTGEDAPEYVPYNCASFDRGRRDKAVPRVILVHRGAWARKFHRRRA